MADEKAYVHLSVFLVKDEYKNQSFRTFLAKNAKTNSHTIDQKLNINGKLYIKKASLNKPKWATLTEQIVGNQLDELKNKSSSAVLLLKAPNHTFAFTFGYGRHLIDHKYFVSDFGIKTALNTLMKDSLRCVDLYTLEDQALQRKAQAVRESDISIFGIDVTRDILRAVTGSAKQGVDYKNISGGDAVYSFGIEMIPSDLPTIATQLAGYYECEEYKKSFVWVDNIRRLKDKSKIEDLDKILLKEIEDRNHKDVTITVPEIVPWDKIFGFSFTRSKKDIQPILNSKKYINEIDTDNVSIPLLKRDKLFIYDTNDFETKISIYNCLYFEVNETEKTYILFSGQWYEIDNDFMNRIDNLLSEIPDSTIDFPDIYTWEENDKKKIETEGDYNERTATECGFSLLDKKLVKSDKTTTPIELCDLLTTDGHFIHAKHRKGGSAGLSHLFAQGNVAAEVLLGDRKFRINARKVLKKINSSLPDLISIDKYKSDNFEIVYLILGESTDTVKMNLPFFSKVNLTKAFENLSQRGYKVSIAGAAQIARP